MDDIKETAATPELSAAEIAERDAKNVAENHQHPVCDSEDGFLVDAQPKHGSIVYNEAGEELGRVSFFYDRVKDHVYRVQVKNGEQLYGEDPLMVAVKPITVEGVEVGHRLIAYHGVASKIPNNNLGARVVITNRALDHAGL